MLKAIVRYSIQLSLEVDSLVDLPGVLADLQRDVADIDEVVHGCLAQVDLRQVTWDGERADE